MALPAPVGGPGKGMRERPEGRHGALRLTKSISEALENGAWMPWRGPTNHLAGSCTVVCSRRAATL